MLAFFPFAFSGICDKEMCMFRDEFEHVAGPRGPCSSVSVSTA